MGQSPGLEFRKENQVVFCRLEFSNGGCLDRHLATRELGGRYLEPNDVNEKKKATPQKSCTVKFAGFANALKAKVWKKENQRMFVYTDGAGTDDCAFGLRMGAVRGGICRLLNQRTPRIEFGCRNVGSSYFGWFSQAKPATVKKS